MALRRLSPATACPRALVSSVHCARRWRHISGFEDHPFFGPKKQQEEREERGFKRFTPKNGTPAEKQDRSHKAPDTRYATDYREVQDNDPYSGLFNERNTVGRTRLHEWRKQFEKENEDTELPYERTNLLFRTVPNSFVRMMIRIRNHQGADAMYVSCIMGFFVFVGVMWGHIAYRGRGETLDVRKIQ